MHAFYNDDDDQRLVSIPSTSGPTGLANFQSVFKLENYFLKLRSRMACVPFIFMSRIITWQENQFVAVA